MAAVDGNSFMLEVELTAARAELDATRSAGRSLAGYAYAAHDPTVKAGFQARADACKRHVLIQERTVRDLEAQLEGGR